MSSPEPKISLPVVAAEDYRHAVAGEPWELCPIAITGPIQHRSSPRDDSFEATRRLAEISLQTPLDYPAIGDAILAGDHVALAVDPNVPRVAEVIAGVLDLLKSCEAGRVSIVLWAEASDTCYQSLTQRFQNVAPEDIESGSAPGGDALISVMRHCPRDRREMRYVAADADAEAIYLARDLVDADFTIPIVAARARDAADRADKAAVFPIFADASTMQRYQTTVSIADSERMAEEVSWLLGVQLLMMVSSDAAGSVARILTGTPEAIRAELDTLHADEQDGSGRNETCPQAEMVVAALDGDANVQTWSNVARAAVAASGHTEGDAAIVVWSQLRERPSPMWQQELSDRRNDADSDGIGCDDSHEETRDGIIEHDSSSASANDFADWSTDRAWARKLGQLIESNRVFLHSELEDSDVESLGLGIINSVDELHRLGQTCQAAGMLRAAQFQASSIARSEAATEEG
ncbi:transcriptional regulator [Allorhodopirellula heiligendammensis]|uniref:LarA-like N-terminal domain-containing protein n=1 Tax=Allorhodopirellula heiligendammensis TaxID=2714739 RepID=A0A5C6BUM1_9BACT|nr:transcriptional regulator [Allorhodopirellula heiligendammensis]TWU15347.1 hypothetical protein Poly21_25420 [Allorhodopirellula heiligendammensis]